MRDRAKPTTTHQSRSQVADRLKSLRSLLDPHKSKADSTDEKKRQGAERIEPRVNPGKSKGSADGYWNELSEADGNEDHMIAANDIPADDADIKAMKSDDRPATETAASNGFASLSPDWEDDIPVLTQIVIKGSDTPALSSETTIDEALSETGNETHLSAAVDSSVIPSPADTVTRTFSELLDDFFISLGYEDDLTSLDQLSKSAMEKVNDSVLATTGTSMRADQKRQLRRDIEDLLVDWARQYQQKLKQRLTRSFDE